MKRICKCVGSTVIHSHLHPTDRLGAKCEACLTSNENFNAIAVVIPSQSKQKKIKKWDFGLQSEPLVQAHK